MANTERGPQKQHLPKGKYKSLPNHVMTTEGIHSYAPVDLTPAEMHRLVEQIHTDEFAAAHPALQAAYAHYALVAIHPFTDGNGRVARALASVFTYRADSIPVLILADEREEYFDSLAEADEGDPKPFVDFIQDRGLSTMELVLESILAGLTTSPSESISDLKGLYVTKAGYTHAHVDDAGYKFVELVQEALARVAKENSVKDLISIQAGSHPEDYEATEADMRCPVKNAGRVLVIQLASTAPAKAAVGKQLRLEVPRDYGRGDDLRLVEVGGNAQITARIDDLMPTPKTALTWRVGAFAERFIGQALAELTHQAKKALQGQ